MAILIIAKVLFCTSLLISIIMALEVDEDYQIYFNDELNVPPPQMETFKNYEEMRKYLENNSNVELIDNPTFDTYLSAYNLHHIRHEKPEISQRLSMLKRTKRRAFPIPYDFIKFELSDAIIPDKATRELINKHREREPKNLETIESQIEDVLKEKQTPKMSKDSKKEVKMTKLKMMQATTTTTTPKNFVTENTTTESINKTRRVTRRVQRRKLRQSQIATPIKRMDTNLDRTMDMDVSNKDDSDLKVHETQNIHYYAAMPSVDSINKYKRFPHEVQKAIDFVLGENKQTNQNIGGKTANLKYIQIPIYHKQPFHGDKIALYQTPKIGNKNHPNGYESYNKYLQAYSLPLVTSNNNFKQLLTVPLLNEPNAAQDIEKIHQQQQQQQYYLSHQYYEQYPKQYYTIQTTANSLPVTYQENPLQEIKQTATNSVSSSSDIDHIPTSHQDQFISKTANSDNLIYSQVTQEPPLNSIGHSNMETGVLNVQPDISQVHTIIQPQAVTVKFPLPEIKYVFHQQDIAAEAAPVSLKLEPVTPPPVRTYTLAIPKPTPSSALIKNDNNDGNVNSSDDDNFGKSAQSLEAEKSLIPDNQYKNYELPQHQQHQHHNRHYYHHQVYAPISLQNEMLAKAVLINHGYTFDDSTNLASSDAHSSGDDKTENISIKNGKGSSSSINGMKSEGLNEKYSIKSSPLPSHAYILSTTPSTYYSYVDSNTASTPLQQHHQQHYEEIQEHQYQQEQHHNQQQQQQQYKEEEILSVTSGNHYNEIDKASATVLYPVNNNEKDLYFETTSQNYKELSSLIGKSPTDQMNGLNYLIEKELQNNILKSKENKRPQDNRSPILFHPDQKNGGDNLKGKKVFINEYGFKEIKNENSDPSSSTIEKPNKVNENHHGNKNVVHITPPPPSSSTSYNQYNLLSPNYKFGTRLHGLHESKDKDIHGLQYASKYAFGYRVRDFHTGNDFGHKQKRDHDGVTRGEYHILLPDGRVQNVRYTADDSGFHADVSFETGP